MFARNYQGKVPFMGLRSRWKDKIDGRKRGQEDELL
jgi:hypothetical protein